jgi:hypothetical protein
MGRSATSFDLPCRKLQDFASDKLAAVRDAFANADPCELRQHWLPKPEPDFLPAQAWVGWRGQELLVFAELTDADIFTNATALNQYTWELGDVLEIFLQPVQQEAYLEFHVAPNNQRLQLRFPSASAQDTAPPSAFMIAGEMFRSRTWVRPEARQWFVLAEIPVASVCDRPAPLPGSEWRFSISRYDYTRGRTEPVCSSTSPHPVMDFHRQQEWGTLRFVA